MIFPDKFFEEEVLWGHVVTEIVKKVWATEINILEVFDEICRRNNLKYYAGFGTLLGLVRHQGFIPWDDDIDVVMMRPDYERMKSIIVGELAGTPFEFQDEMTPFQLRSFCKIRDPRTTGIEFVHAPFDFNQGLFIDIFPMDDACDSPEAKTPTWEMEREMWCALTNPAQMADILSKDNHLLLPPDILRFMMTDQTGQGLLLFNSFCRDHFGETGKVNLLIHELNSPGRGIDKRNYSEVVYLPFNGFDMPAPVGYDWMLHHQFGNFMTPIKGASLHAGMITDPDRPYREVLAELKG